MLILPEGAGEENEKGDHGCLLTTFHNIFFVLIQSGLGAKEIFCRAGFSAG